MCVIRLAKHHTRASYVGNLTSKCFVTLLSDGFVSEKLIKENYIMHNIQR